MALPTVHIPWDYGAVSSLFVSVLKPKTRKTLCGRQVTFRNTTECIGAVDCEACLETHKRNLEEAVLMERITREIRGV